jgi:Papain fold toxin 2
LPGELRQKIKQIADRYRVFQCVECANAIQTYLVEQKITGTRIRLDIGFRNVPWSVIYDLKRAQQISTTGCHEGIAVLIDNEEVVFDNLDQDGVDRATWLRNFTSPTIELGRGQFSVLEEFF